MLGEIGSCSTKISGWDTMLHTINGFLAAAIGFSLVDILNRNKKAKFNIISALYGNCGVLLFHDNRGYVGIL